MATNMVIFKDLKTAELPSESTLQQGKIIFDLDNKTISIDDYTTASPTGLVRIKMYDFIGTLSSLNTYVTTSIVGAINWLHTKVINGIAQEYSSSSTYKIGQYVFYQGVLYKCITSITTTETWNPLHWTLARVTEELYNIYADNIMFAGEYTGNSLSLTIGDLSTYKYVEITNRFYGSKSRIKTKIKCGESGIVSTIQNIGGTMYLFTANFNIPISGTTITIDNIYYSSSFASPLICGSDQFAVYQVRGLYL